MKIIQIDDHKNLFHIQVNNEELRALAKISGKIGGKSKLKESLNQIYYFANDNNLGDSPTELEFSYNSIWIDDKPQQKQIIQNLKGIVKTNDNQIRDNKGRFASYSVSFLYPNFPSEYEVRYLKNYSIIGNGRIEGFDIKRGGVRSFILSKCKDIVYY